MPLLMTIGPLTELAKMPSLLLPRVVTEVLVTAMSVSASAVMPRELAPAVLTVPLTISTKPSAE